MMRSDKLEIIVTRYAAIVAGGERWAMTRYLMWRDAFNRAIVAELRQDARDSRIESNV